MTQTIAASGVANLTEDEKRTLLANLLNRKAEAEQSFPLSFAQQRLWFLDRLTPDNPAYNIPGVFRLQGALDLAALAGALGDVAARHATLRTVFFANEMGEARQRVRPAGDVDLPVTELIGADAAEKLAALAKLVDEEVCRPFDLGQGPMFRARLLRLGEQDHVLVLVIHHICADGWSLGVFNRDLSMAYEARRGGGKPAFAPLAASYTDYTTWQRADLSGRRLAPLLDFWGTALADLPALNLPSDHPRPPVQRYRGGAVNVTLSAAVVEEARELARSEGTTLFCVLLAAFHLVLARLSGQEDFAIAVPVANRERLEVEQQIGFFVNTLPMRFKTSGVSSFRELVHQVTRVSRTTQQHQDLPFEKLVEELKVDRDTSRNPLVQVMFALQNAPMQPLQLAGLAISTHPYTLAATRFDLELHLWDGRYTWTGAIDGQAGLTGTLFYNADLFEPHSASALAAMVGALLQDAVKKADAEMSEISLQTASTEQAILAAGGSKADLPPPADLAVMIDRAAASFADREAISGSTGAMAYADLLRRADRLHRAFARRGLQKGSVVALMLERGSDMVTSMVAALRGGYTFAPIDPRQPTARIERMLQICGASLILTQASASNCFSIPAETVGALLEDADDSLQSNADDGDRGAVPLYVVFTSGSTGQPKGVAMPAPAFANLIAAQCLSLPKPVRTLQSSAVGFDVAIQEVFHTLATGGTLIPVSHEERLDPDRLIARMRQDAVERIYMPFTLLSMLIGALAASGETLPALREIITAGEQPRLTPEMRGLFAAHGTLRLINQYGPAETHVVSEAILDGDPWSWPDLPLAGQAVPGNRLHVLDAYGQIQPFGVPGEVCIGGVQLASGYVGDEALTRERFIADPFDDRAGARLYRTGDRAKLDSDGNLHFLGRMDAQVKIRGFRVEPAEIELQLLGLPEISGCCVLSETNLQGQTSLAAYVQVVGAAPGAASLRDRLRPHLPDYMIPASFAAVDRIPLSANGKVDRHALVQLAARLPEQVTGQRSARTEVEKKIAAIWSAVLGIDAIGIDATFFDMGGNSLLILQVHDRLKRELHPDLTVSELFQFPSVETLARHIESRSNPPAPSLSVAAVNDRAQRQRAQMRGGSR